MRKIFTLFLALVASTGTIFADGIQIGDLYYNLNADNKTAEVMYQEYLSSTNYSYLTAVNIPESVEYNSVTYSVTSIGYGAFAYCSGLTSIEIPNSVTSIGWSAFFGCSGLTSVTLNSNAIVSKNYTDNSNIKDIFGTQVTEYILGNSVTSIGIEAFYKCSGLTSITIPNSVTSIGDGAFAECSGLTSIEIPNSVTSIGVGAFIGCTGLTSITIPNSVTSIGDYAFAGCSGLTSITIPNSVTSIGFGAFKECYSLTSIEIPNSVTSIGAGAFWDCSGLTSVTIPNSVTSIEREAFYKCSGLTSVTIPNSVTSIGGYAFYGCSGLTSPVFNTHVFAYLPTSYEGTYSIPEGIESIAGGAFSRCSGLTSIEIPNSVTNIGRSAFYGCSGLTSVTNYATTPQEINSNVFEEVNKSACTLYVPAESLKAYQAAKVWKNFTNIQAILNPMAVPEIYTNPANSAQKLIRNGNVYILTDGKTYNVTGALVK